MKDEDREALDRVRRAEFKELMRRAVRLASLIYDHDPAYARMYVDGTAWEMWRDYPEPPKSRVYKKEPIPKALRKKVLERDQYRCVMCGDWHDLHVDHIHPESKGGEATSENLQTLCRACNVRKGARV